MHFTLCDLASDIVQNAAESGASLVSFEIKESDSEFSFILSDNGKGMTAFELEKAKDPFHTDGIKHPNRRVGLGIPFLIQTASQDGSSWSIESEKGKGTTVEARFNLLNIDTPPVGDVRGLIRTVLMFQGPAELQVKRSRETGQMRNAYELAKSELMDVLGSLEDAGALVLLDTYLRSLEEIENNNE
ncbi:ATP-binding protein [Treponema sp.]